MRKITMFVLFFSLVFVNVVQAVTISVPGRSIEINESAGGAGSVNIKGVDGTTVLDVNKSVNGASTVTTPGSTINVAPGKVQINANGSTLNVNKGSEGLNVEISGQKIKIKSDNDLETYKQMVLDNCATLSGIDTSGSRVEVKYNQPARFFGIFKSNLDAKVSVGEDGKVEVKLPWYRFLFTKNAGEIKSQIQAKVDSNAGISVGLERKALMVNLVNENLSLNVAPCKVFVSGNTNINANTASGDTNTPASANSSVNVVASFVGEWNGTYAVSAFSDKDCASGGSASFTIDNKGGAVGYATVEGVKAPGAGTVDANGNLKGTWTLSGVALDFSGKLNTITNKGSGTYQNKLGCFGTFSLSR